MYRLRWACALLFALTAAANAQVSLNSVRVVAKDAEALGKFYATVRDAAATAAAAKGAGGTVAREAAQFGNSGILIAFVVDPEGNRIELIRQPRR